MHLIEVSYSANSIYFITFMVMTIIYAYCVPGAGLRACRHSTVGSSRQSHEVSIIPILQVGK